jgi:hypothetical protein
MDMQAPHSPSLFPELNYTDPLSRHFSVRKTPKKTPKKTSFRIYADEEEEEDFPPNRVRLRSNSPLPSPSPLQRRTQKRKLSQLNKNNNNHNNYNFNINNNEDKNYEAELNKLQEEEILKITKAYKKKILTIKNKYEQQKQIYYTNKLNSTMLLSGKFPSQ